MDQQLVGFAEAAKVLGVSEPWLRKAVSKGDVAHHRLGKLVRFTQDDIEAIIEGSAFVPTPLTAGPIPSKQQRRMESRVLPRDGNGKG